MSGMRDCLLHSLLPRQALIRVRCHRVPYPGAASKAPHPSSSGARWTRRRHIGDVVGQATDFPKSAASRPPLMVDADRFAPVAARYVCCRNRVGCISLSLSIISFASIASSRKETTFSYAVPFPTMGVTTAGTETSLPLTYIDLPAVFV